MSNCVEIKTVQSSSFKILFEALKEILTECVIDISNDGLKIVSMNNSHVVLVHLKLNAEKFEYYKCDQPKQIGVNMINLHKIIKTINNGDILTIFMETGDDNHLRIKIENSEKNTKTIYKVNLLDIENSNIEIPPTQFNSVVNLTSSDFQKICRNMSKISDTIEIKNIDNQLILTCHGDFCSQETVISANNESPENKDKDEIIQGVFNLKLLTHFTKCTNLSSNIELYLKNDYPLIVKYNVASLGNILLCLAPHNE